MAAQTNKSILITPGSYSGLSTSVSQIDLKWYESGIGTFVFTPNVDDLRSTIYNWEQNSEPVILLGGIGTLNNQRKFVGPYQDYVGSFIGISSFPAIQFFPLSGKIVSNTITVSGIASFSQIFSVGLSTFSSLNLSGPFYDRNFSPGTAGQILSSTANGVEWIPTSSASIGGSISSNQVAFGSSSNTIQGISTFVFRNGSLGIGLTNPRGSFETTEEIYVDKIYIGTGNSFTNTIIGFGATNYDLAVQQFIDRTTIIGRGINSSINVGYITPGILIGDSANSNNNTPNYQYPSIIIGNDANSNNQGVRPQYGDVVIGHGAKSRTYNDDADTGGNVVIGNNAYAGSVSQVYDVGNVVAIGEQASYDAAHASSVVIGSFAGIGSFLLANQNSGNVIVGTGAGGYNNGSFSNTFIGGGANANYSADNPFSGNYNIAIGYAGGVTNGSYQIAIGIDDNTRTARSNAGAWGGITNATRTDLGIGTLNPLARFHVETLNAGNTGFYLAGQPSQTANLFRIDRTINGNPYFVINGIGSVGIYTSAPTQALDVLGNVRFRGNIFDSSNASGTANQILVSTSSGVLWTSANTIGVVTGINGETNYVAKFSSPNSLTTSNIIDNGAVITIGLGMSVNGFSSSLGFYGPATNLTNLNASNLASGTVPSAVVSGNYSGITSVGTLSQLRVTGLSTANNIAISGALYDSVNNVGLANSVLTSTGSGLLWAQPSAGGGGGTIGGSINVNQIAFGASTNTIQGLGTFVFRNGALGIGLTNPRGSLETTEEIYVDNIYIGVGNSFTNTIIGFGATNYDPDLQEFFDRTTIFGRGINSSTFVSRITPGILIGDSANSNNNTAFQQHPSIVIGNYANSGNQNIKPTSGDVIIGHGAKSNTYNDDTDTGRNVVIGNEAYFGLAGITYDIGATVVIGDRASYLASHSESVVIGADAGFGTATIQNSSFSNVIVGTGAGQFFNSASSNIIVGANANHGFSASNPFTGFENISISGGGGGVSNGSYQISIGLQFNNRTARSNAGAWGGKTNATRTDLGIGTLNPLSRLHVETLDAGNAGFYLAGQPSQTANLFRIDRTINGNPYLVINGIGSVGIYTSAPTQAFDVLGNVRFRGNIFDSSNTSGTANQILVSTSSGILWTSANTIGVVTGINGETNYIAKFGSPNSLTTSNIIDNGSVVTIGLGMSVNGFSSSLGFYGPGTNLTNLNASNITSGIVTSARVSGSYSGITSVGNLTQLSVIGIASISQININPEFSQVLTYVDGSLMLRPPTVFEAFTTLGISSDGVDTGGYTDISQFLNTGVTTLLSTSAFSRLYLGWINFLPRELRAYSSAGNVGLGGTCQWQRWSGSAWVNITGDNLVANGGSVTIPTTGTTRTNINGVEAYWIRATAVTTYTTPPRMRLTRASSASNLPTNANPSMYLSGIFVGPSATDQTTMNTIVSSGGGASALFSGLAYGNGEQNIMQIYSGSAGGSIFLISGDGSISAPNADNTFRNLTLNGGSSNQNAVLTLVNGSKSQASWLNSGVLFRSQAGTRTNSSVAGTYPLAVFHSFGIQTLAAANPGTFTTDAANVYIENSIQQGTNQTITNRWALWVDAGDTRLDDNLRVDGRVGVSTNAPLGKLHVETLSASNIGAYIAGQPAQTGHLLEIDAVSQGQPYLVVTGIGSIGVYTSIPTQAFDVSGNVRIRGGVWDSSNNQGLANSVLISTGSGGVQWVAPGTGVPGGGTIGGTISANQVAFGVSANNIQGVSTLVLINGFLGVNTTTPVANLDVFGVVNVTGVVTALGYSGPGTNLTNLSASNLASGTVPSAVVSGNYSGITSVGNLTNLNVIGIASATGFAGDGANLTNLNATNLASGTVASARVSGSYSGITSVGTLSQIIVNGISTLNSLAISSALYDTSGSPGLANSVLTSIGTAVLWSASAGGSGSIGGSINVNQIAFGASTNTIQGLATFVFRNSSLGVGTNIPRGSIETTDEIYVDNIYIGAGNSFTNTIIGFGATSFGVAFVERATIIGRNVNQETANDTLMPGVYIGDSANTNNTFALENFASTIAIGNNALSDNSGGNTNSDMLIIGNNAYRYVSNADLFSGSIVIGHEAYSGNSTNLTPDSGGGGSVVIGNYAAGDASHGSSVLLGFGAGVGSFTLTTNVSNTLIGYNAGQMMSGAANNIFIGYNANTNYSANNPFTGDNNIAIGDGIGVTNGNYQISIGGLSPAKTARSNAGAWGGITNVTRTDLGIGTLNPLSRLHVETLDAGNAGLYLAGQPSQTANLLKVDRTINGNPYFVITGIGSVGVYTSIPTQALDVSGNVRFRGNIFDSSNTSGLANQILVSTSSGILWTSTNTIGVVTGINGLTNYIAKFGSPNSLTTSNIIDNGSVITMGVGMSVNGFSSSLGFYGPGTNLTNLNATNLASGTVPSARISGDYSGITSVGNLTNLNVIGIASATGFTGDGANLTNLNASNLASGTVPTARVSGSYSGITSVGNLTQLNVIGVVTSLGYFGPGTSLTNLNASNLASGTLPTARVSGSYSGITSVGTLSQLIVTGISTLTNASISGFLLDLAGRPGLANSVLTSIGTAVIWSASAGGVGGGTIGGSISVNQIPFGASANTIQGISTFVLNNGLLGVNTNNPLSNLDVFGTFNVSGFSTVRNINLAGRLYDNSLGSGNTGQLLTSTNSGIAWTTIDAIYYSLGANQIAYGIGTTTIAGASTFVYWNGNVGVGTVAPSAGLHVQAGARFNGEIFDRNNSSGGPIGIISQVLTSTGTGVTWAPIKRSLVIPLMTAFTPTQVGIDSAVFIVPQDPINGIGIVTFSFRRVNLRVETPYAGITTINIAKSTGSGRFVGTSILQSNLNIIGATTYESNSTSFAVGYTTCSSGDKLSINFIGVNTFHQNFTVELIAQEA